MLKGQSLYKLKRIVFHYSILALHKVRFNLNLVAYEGTLILFCCEYHMTNVTGSFWVIPENWIKSDNWVSSQFFYDNWQSLLRLVIVVSDGDVPASTVTLQRCIGDILKSWTGLNFSHLDWDVGNTTGTSATSPKKHSYIIVSVPAASPIHWLGRVSRHLRR